VVPLKNMITVPKILGGVCAIFVVIVGAYFIFSSEKEDALIEESPKTEVVDVVPKVENIEPVVSPEVNDTEVTEATPDPVVEATKPTPVPTPAPAPAPVTKTGYTLAEVAQHSTASSCYTTINDGVYDLTSFIKKHPGGAANIMKICGKDGTSLFENQHEGDAKPEATLASFYLGDLIK